ncbi:MAG: methionyl-tRNA formyltransferase [Candidatus Neomarinimicrobiota bacterium]|nr:methionyl-tRNA formyltransferase [Candidatus Neomarinimicrobiota bacterium]
MNLVFMGNPAFAVPALEKLAASDYQIVAVVSNPPQKMGRGKKIRETAIAIKAKSMGLDVIQEQDLKSGHFVSKLKELDADLFVVVAFRILPNSLITIPKLGSINLHGSLLPAYRGAAPIQWALINGEDETGLSTFFIAPKVDTGAVICQDKLPIHPNDNYGTLSERMGILGSVLLVETINLIESGSASAIKQNDNQATLAPKITKDMTIIDWSRPARELHNLVRALTPTPSATTIIKGKRIKIQETWVDNDDNGSNYLPGEITAIKKSIVSVQTGNGHLLIHRVQLEGKKTMDIGSFMNGFALNIGDRFGN